MCIRVLSKLVLEQIISPISCEENSFDGRFDQYKNADMRFCYQKSKPQLSDIKYTAKLTGVLKNKYSNLHLYFQTVTIKNNDFIDKSGLPVVRSPSKFVLIGKRYHRLYILLSNNSGFLVILFRARTAQTIYRKSQLCGGRDGIRLF